MLENIYLRKARKEDAKLVFDLSTDEEVRNFSINKDKFSWEEHLEWFTPKIMAKNTLFLLAFYKDKNLQQIESNNFFIGYVRFELIDKENSWIVSIALSKKYRGKNYSLYTLQKALEFGNFSKVISYIDEKNIPSLKLFKNANFIENNTVDIEGRNFKKCTLTTITN